MVDEIEYHERLRAISQLPTGTMDMCIVARADLVGADAEFLKAVASAAEKDRINQVLNANLQSLGEQVRTLRAQLDDQRGELITFEVTGNVIMSDRDIDNLVDRVWTRFDEQRRATEDEDEDDD